jgi:hypothetical protein
MGFIANKVLKAKASGADLTSGQFTTGVVIGANDATGLDVADVDNMSVEDTVTDTRVSIGYASSVDSTRDLAFYCNVLADELTCVDFSDISNVSVEDSIASSTYIDFPRGVAADPTTEIVYVSGQTPNYFNAVDYSTPSSLSITSSLATTYGGDKIVLDTARDTAFMKAGGRLTSINISNPASMSERTTLVSSTNMNTAGGLAIDTTKDLVFTGHYSNDKVTVIDTSNVASLSVISSLNSVINLNQPSALATDPSKELVFCLCLDSLSVVDYSNTSSMSITDTVSNVNLGGGSGRTLAVDPVRELVFAKARSENNTIYVYDYSDPTSLTLAGTLTRGGDTSGGHILLGGVAP